MSKELYDLKLSLLEAGGIDNWSGYDDAFSMFMENNPDITEDDIDNDSELKLDALEAAGVDNWSYYGEALDGYYAYCDYVHELESDVQPKEFYDFKEQLEEDERREQAQFELEQENARLKEENERLLEQERLRSIIHFPQVYDYISQKHPKLSDDVKKEVYNALIADKGNIFNPTIITNDEFVNAKSEAIASGATTASEFKPLAQQLFIDAIVKNHKIELFIQQYLINVNLMLPSYISYLKVGTACNIVSSAKSVKVVTIGRHMMTVNPDTEMNKYLLKLNKLPQVFRVHANAEKHYENELKKVKDQFDKQEMNIRIARKNLDI